MAVTTTDGVLVSNFESFTDTAKEAIFYQQDGKDFVMAASSDGTIRVFERVSGDCVYTFFNHRAQDMTCLAMHPDNGLVVAGNENSLLYLLKTGQ